MSEDGSALATEPGDALSATDEDGPDNAFRVWLLESDWAGAAVDPSAHTIIAKRKMKLFLIDFQLSVY